MAERKSGHATGMAGEFFVMERLFRLGYQPALTLGNAKSIDILVQTGSGPKVISVKATRGGGKWPVSLASDPDPEHLVYVFLLYRHFDDVTTDPEVWVMPAPDVEDRKRQWFDRSAIYYSHRQQAPADLADFKDAWHHIP